MRTIEINSKEFCSLDGFYRNLEPSLLQGDCPWGQNLDSLDEIVSCNFNYTENKDNDVNLIIWRDYQKSRNEIRDIKANKLVIDMIEEIFESNETIKFIKK